MPLTEIIDYSGTMDTVLYETGNYVLNQATLSGYSSIKITGSNPIPSINMTGTGSVFLLYHNNMAYISGQPVPVGAGEANTASNLGNGMGLYAQKVGVDLQFYSITGGTGICVCQSGAHALINDITPFSLQLVSSAVTYTNMPVATNFLAGSTAYRTYVDLSPYTQMRMIGAIGTVGTTSGRVFVGYRDFGSATATDYSQISENDTRIMMTTVGVYVSGWHTLKPAARSGVYIALLVASGNAVADPVVGMTFVQFR